MLRFVLIALALVALLILTLRLVKDMRGANIDWQGIGFAAAFIALAFYLRHATGLG